MHWLNINNGTPAANSCSNEHCIAAASVNNQKSILAHLDWFICDPQWCESKNPKGSLSKPSLAWTVNAHIHPRAAKLIGCVFSVQWVMTQNVLPNQPRGSGTKKKCLNIKFERLSNVLFWWSA